MARPFFVLLCLSLLSACTQRLICPAYQSAFIYDKDELRKKFSYFLEDSTPKILTASKTKYLIAEPVSYRKKLRSLQTVAMKDINPKLPDSLMVGFEEGLAGEAGEDGVVPGAELDLAARSVIDSTYIVDVPQDTTQAQGDSVYVITKDREVRLLKYDFPDSLIYDESSGRYVPETPKYVVTEVRYNVEQDNYMWYLRKNLVLPDVRLAQLQQTEDKSAKKEKKEKKGFFRNLFKRKKKEPVDSTAIEIPTKSADDFDYVDEGDSTQTKQAAPAALEKKKGPFSFLKKKEKAPQSPDDAAPIKEKKKKREKKPKKSKRDETVPEIEEKKEEDKDDGF